MYKTLVIIRENNWTLTPSGGVLLRPEYDRRCSIHYPAYYTATCQNEKITSHGVSFYNIFVTSIRSVN